MWNLSKAIWYKNLRDFKFYIQNIFIFLIFILISFVYLKIIGIDRESVLEVLSIFASGVLPMIIIFQVFHLVTFDNTCGNLKYIIMACKGRGHYIIEVLFYFISFIMVEYIVAIISIVFIINRLDNRFNTGLKMIKLILDFRNIDIFCFVIGSFLPIMVFSCILLSFAFFIKDYRIASLVMCGYTFLSNFMQLASGRIKYFSCLYYVNLFKFSNDIIVICSFVISLIFLSILLRELLNRKDFLS